MPVILCLLLTACSWQPYDEGLEKGETPPAPNPSTILRKVTLADAEDILNLSPLLSMDFDKVDAASKGISNTQGGLGDDFSEVNVVLRDEPFQMIWGVMTILDGRVERRSMDAAMNNEATISDIIMANVRAGALEEGFELDDIELNITYPSLGDMAFLGKGFLSTVGLEVGFDALWFRSNTVYILLYSTYYTSERYTLLPIAKELERRVSQFSQ